MTRRGWHLAAAILTCFFLAAPSTQVAQAADAAKITGPAQGAQAPDTLLDVVMLIDESGSETPISVEQEKQVAATIGQSMLNPASRVTVVGFGGVNGEAPNQDPIDVACQPTIANTTANLNYLSTCVNSLHQRTEAQGDDTDYAAALGQAMTYLNPGSANPAQSPPGAQKVILMMTDGGVDVRRDTKQYGTDWLSGEKQAVNVQLAQAKQDGVQVWTLGMGTDITSTDYQYLQYLAAQGAQSSCGNGPKPHATLVSDRSEALGALNELYAEASCSGVSKSPKVPIGNGTQAGTLQVTIPAIASKVAISVDRGDPGVQVQFYEPNGTQWTDNSAISGTGSVVAVLHVSNPMPGTWTMKLTAPPAMKQEVVDATAFWQGAVRALIIANPSSALPGQKINVTLSVLGSNGNPVTDPSTVAKLEAGVTVSGDGVTQTVVPVSNAGETNASSTGVADYTGSFAAPTTTGTLTFTGTARGYGLYATGIPASVQVSPAAVGLTATVQFPAGASVQAGSSVTGNVSFSNSTGAAKSVRVALSGVANGDASLASPTGPVSVPGSNPPQQPVTISVSKDAPIGSTWVRVEVTDAANPGTVYGDQLVDITVTKPPGFWAKYHWLVTGILLLIALIVAAVLFLLAQRRRRVDVRSLTAVLTLGDEQKGTPLRPDGQWSDTFRFVVLDEDDVHARLAKPTLGSGEPFYTTRRQGPGRLRVWTPAGTDHEVTIGDGLQIGHGLRLSFRDSKKRTGGGGVPIGIPVGFGRGNRRAKPARPEQAASQPSQQDYPGFAQQGTASYGQQPGSAAYGQPFDQTANGNGYADTQQVPYTQPQDESDEWL